MATMNDSHSRSSHGEPCEEGTGLFITVAAGILLFLLIMGLAGSVDTKTLKMQMHRKKGIAIALLCQFFAMPFIGFVVVKVAQPLPHVGLMIMILCSSSGGAYSNWWCSLFNADLALSVAMTAVSTLMSGFMLPLNLSVYLKLIGNEATVDIPWGPLFQSLGTVLAAIIMGVGISTKCPTWTRMMTAVGNISGICMIGITLAASMIKKKPDTPGEEITPLWGHSASFYAIIVAPFFMCLLFSFCSSSLRCLALQRPERLAIAVEVSYQNIGIASAVAVTAFCGNAKLRADAAAVPVIYGFMEAVCLALLCVIMWKCGWTYAPARGVSLMAVIKGDFQPRLSADSVQVDKSTASVSTADQSSAVLSEKSSETVVQVESEAHVDEV